MLQLIATPQGGGSAGRVDTANAPAQSYLVAGLYAALSAVAADGFLSAEPTGNDRSEAARRAGNPEAGSSDGGATDQWMTPVAAAYPAGGELAEASDRDGLAGVLTTLYGTGDALSLALAADDGTSRAALLTCADTLRECARELRSAAGFNPPAAQDGGRASGKAGQAGTSGGSYQRPVGSAPLAGHPAPKSAAEAGKYALAAMDVAVGTLRRECWTAQAPATRAFAAAWAGECAHASAQLEKNLGRNPGERVVRGDSA